MSEIEIKGKQFTEKQLEDALADKKAKAEEYIENEDYKEWRNNKREQEK